ncbi:MAG: hypothetical protein ACOC2M_00610, partial [bacterium]
FTKNTMAPLPLVRINNQLVQKIDPVYLDPQDRGIASFRAHFLAPNKNFLGNLVPTFYFNIAMIWFFTIVAYIFLYYNGLTRFLQFLERVPPLLKSLQKNNKEEP